MRRWQVWNEPNFSVFWSKPSPRGYVRVLRAAATTIRELDPRALVVAAGLAPIERQPAPWDFLRRIYAVPGARAAFDVAALHPYSASLAGVKYVLRETRRVMARAGDAGKPLLVSEVGVASDARAPTGFDRGPAGQARFLERSFATLYLQRRRWRLAGLFWFAYQDVLHSDLSCAFCESAGLFTVDGRPKLSWAALRRVVIRARRGAFR